MEQPVRSDRPTFLKYAAATVVAVALGLLGDALSAAPAKPPASAPGAAGGGGAPKLVLPSTGKGPFPVVVLVGTLPGFDVLTQHGFAVAYVGGASGGSYVSGYRSGKAGVRWLHANAASANIDPERIAVIGRSASGNAATGVATSSGLSSISFGENIVLDRGGAGSDRVRCAVNLSGATDLMQTDRFRGTMGTVSGTGGGAMGFPVAEALATSPINYISSDDPPVLQLFFPAPGLHGWVSGHRFDVAYRQAGRSSTLMLSGEKDWEEVTIDFLAVHLQDRTQQRVHLVPGCGASVADNSKGWFTVARFGATDKPLTVRYTAGAGVGTLCKQLSGTVTIPAGATTAEVVIEGLKPGTVALSLSDDPSYEVGHFRNAKLTIVAGDVPGVYAVATVPYAKPPSGGGAISVARWGSTASAITVAYTVLGNAVAGTDYQALPGTITIPAGARSATITVKPLRYPNSGEPWKSVAIALEPGDGCEYCRYYCAAGCVIITDATAPAVSDISDPFTVR